MTLASFQACRSEAIDEGGIHVNNIFYIVGVVVVVAVVLGYLGLR